MKLKLLALCATTLLTLTACGGGEDNASFNSNTNPSTPTPAFQQWFVFDLDSDSDQLNYESSATTIQNNKLYVEGSADDSFLVTPNGFYDQGPLNRTYGYLNGNISINNNIWTLSPYSSLNSSDLKIATTTKQLNLEGENMAAKVDLYNYWLIKNSIADDGLSNQAKKYLKAISSVKFPAGSTCLQFQKVNNSEAYLDLENSANDQNTLSNQWNALSIDKNAKKYIMKDTLAYLLTNDDASEDGIAQYKNRFYDAYLSPKGTEYNLQYALKSFDTWAASTDNAAEKARILELKNLTENACNLYNNIAIKAMKDNFERYK